MNPSGHAESNNRSGDELPSQALFWILKALDRKKGEEGFLPMGEQVPTTIPSHRDVAQKTRSTGAAVGWLGPSANAIIIDILNRKPNTAMTRKEIQKEVESFAKENEDMQQKITSGKVATIFWTDQLVSNDIVKIIKKKPKKFKINSKHPLIKCLQEQGSVSIETSKGTGAA